MREKVASKYAINFYGIHDSKLRVDSKKKNKIFKNVIAYGDADGYAWL